MRPTSQCPKVKYKHKNYQKQNGPKASLCDKNIKLNSYLQDTPDYTEAVKNTICQKYHYRQFNNDILLKGLDYPATSCCV